MAEDIAKLAAVWRRYKESIQFNLPIMDETPLVLKAMVTIGFQELTRDTLNSLGEKLPAAESEPVDIRFPFKKDKLSKPDLTWSTERHEGREVEGFVLFRDGVKWGRISPREEERGWDMWAISVPFKMPVFIEWVQQLHEAFYYMEKWCREGLPRDV